MAFDARTITLRDGREAVLRLARKEDAAEMLQFVIDTAGETDFLNNYPEERRDMTVAQEEAFIRRMNEDEHMLFILCEAEGRIAGNCMLQVRPHMKLRHRGTIGISVRKAYWGQGIGTAMFEALIAQGRQWGLMLLELEFYEGNSRARGLYEKMGFRIVGVHPDAARLKDGTLLNEYLMQLRL